LIPARLGACAVALALGWAGAAAADTQKLVILHDNDIHGHLREFCYIERAKGPVEHCQIGGAARRMTLIRALKAKAAAPVLLVDSGDTTTRGPLATQYEGVDEVDAMNAIGYDIAAVGNNEFKLKDAADIQDAAGAQADLQRLFRMSDFPWICANVTDANGALMPGVQPFVVRRFGALRVAFLGLTTQRSKTYPQTKGLVFLDPVDAAKTWIPRALAEADVVVAVTHMGVFDDQRLAKNTKGLAAIVGGDSHTYLYQPVVEKNLDGADVPIVQDGEFGVRLGEFDLTFEGDTASGWRLTHYADQLIAVDAASKPDPSVAALVERWAHPMDVPVGSVAKVGATPAERTALTASDLAQAWKAAAGADVGVQAEGDLFESFRTRAVTRYQVHAIVPFHDTVWRGTLTGAQLKALVDKPPPGAIAVHETLDPAQIDPAKTYTVAANTFEAPALTGAADTGVEARAAAESWLAAQPKP
jgi:2',3'-cyclic-nucleotide 2'-phosphodiesterase (5'-nucleotidase family)